MPCSPETTYPLDSRKARALRTSASRRVPSRRVNNTFPGTATVKQRQEIIIHLPVQERVECFGNQEYLPIADGTILKVWRKYRAGLFDAG